jgi:hypothetical protein
MALKVGGENGHLARANGAIDGPYCSPTWSSVFGKRCELHQRPQAARGALLQFECLRKKTKNARCPGLPPLRRKAWPGWLSSVLPLSRGGGRGNKAVAFHNLQVEAQNWKRAVSKPALQQRIRLAETAKLPSVVRWQMQWGAQGPVVGPVCREVDK